MHQPKWFDCGALLITSRIRGPYVRTHFLTEKDLKQPVNLLKREMQSVGINSALVYSQRCLTLHPTEGNKDILQQIHNEKGLYPSWVLLPNQTRELGGLGIILNEMEENNVRAARLNPATLGHSLGDWTTRHLFTALEKREVPFFIDNFGDWETLDSLLPKYPKLKVIIDAYGHSARRLYPLMQRHRNLYISTGRYDLHNGIEELVELFGAERVLFSTAYPLSPACQKNMVTYAEISDYDKQLIASKNLQEILQLSKVDEIQPGPKVASEIEARARERKPQKGFTMIDVHMHIGPDYGWHAPGYDAEGFFKAMNAVGLTMGCINHYFGLGGEMIKGNDAIAEIVKKHPDRFIPFALIDPNYPREEVEAEITRCFEKLGFKGVKIHPAPQGHDVSILDERYEPVWKGAEKYGYVILSHTTFRVEGPTCEPDHYDIIAEKHPDITIFLGHSGNNPDGVMKCIELAKKHKNLYLDLSGWGTPYSGMIERMVEEVGADRIVFGSDVTWINLHFALGPIFYAKIPDEDKKKILGGNIKRLLKI